MALLVVGALCVILLGPGLEGTVLAQAEVESGSVDGLPPPAPETPAAPAPPTIRALKLAGKLHRSDSDARIRQFLDVKPPFVWDEALTRRVERDLDALGYAAKIELHALPQAAAPAPGVGPDAELVVTVQPIRVVRRLFVRGNWPIFAREVLSYLTWRTGYRLPEGDKLSAEIRKQEEELVRFLQLSGYYDANAIIQLEWDEATPELVDVHIRISLNVGFWRLKYNIGNLNAEGFTLLSKRELYDRFDHCCLWFGRTSNERIADDLKNLLEYYHSKGYAGVRLTKKEIRPDRAHRRVDLDIAIDERKRINIRFPGRKALSESQVRGAMTIFRDNYYSANEFDESAREIYRLYQKSGYYEAKVSWRWRNRDSDPIEVDFLIDEGPLLKIRDLEFVPAPGAPALSFSAAKLEGQIVSRRYPRLGVIGLGQGGFASAVQIEQDLRKLAEFYRREGFPEAKLWVTIGRSRAALDSVALLGLQSTLRSDENSGDLYLRFEIEEGRRELVESVSVTFVGPHDVSEQEVRKVLSLQPGKPYTTVDLLADKGRLSELFGKKAHPYPDIDAAGSQWNEDHTRISMRWQIQEHEKVKFGPILIRGNFATRESIIRRDLPFKAGDDYNASLLLEAEQNLKSRQIFSSVTVVPNPGETDEYLLEAKEKGWKLRRNPIPILIEVIEAHDNSGEIGVFLGVSTDNPFYGAASYTWRNLGGVGAEFEILGELGVRVQSILARIAQPRLLIPNLRLDVKGFWRNENTPSLGLVTFYGANLELTRFIAQTDAQGRRLPPTLRFYTRLEFNISQILVPLSHTEGTTDVTVDGDRTQSLKLTMGVVWDKRVGFWSPSLRLRGLPAQPNPIMPVRGHMLWLQATVAMCCQFSGADFRGSFAAFGAQAMVLRPFGPDLAVEDGWPGGMKRFNFKANLRVNYGIPFVRDALPVVERYYAGGDNATRGYDNQSLKAEEARVPVGALGGDPGYRIQPLGGSVRILSEIEWEFAITQKLFGWPWVGALFVDTGVVADGWQRITWNDVRFSVGVSFLRLLTQFGAISLDYAYPLTLPGQEPLLQSERWRREPWYSHFPGRIHFNWGLPILF